MLNIWNTLLIKLLQSLPYGKIKLTLPNKSSMIIKGKFKGPSADIHINSTSSIKKIMTQSTVGFANEFIENKIQTSNLLNLMYYFAINDDFISKKIRIGVLFRILNALSHYLNKNTKRNAEKNIKAHYDLGNLFYKSWLDKTMTYSSGIFKNKQVDLFSAQKNKYHRITKLAEITQGDKILEIGCGWGGLIDYISKSFNKTSILATTISQEQFNYANQKLNKSKSKYDLTVVKKDYRDLLGKFDKIISIEMFEAVGHEYWNTYFKKIRSLIKENGIVLLQVITIKDEKFEEYKNNPDFVQKYIFPGGMLPSTQILKKIINKNSLCIKSIDSYPLDYAKTLNIWRKNFNAEFYNIKKLGFDEKFSKLWNLYLAYCEAGFRSNHIDLKQIKILPI